MSKISDSWFCVSSHLWFTGHRQCWREVWHHTKKIWREIFGQGIFTHLDYRDRSCSSIYGNTIKACVICAWIWTTCLWHTKERLFKKEYSIIIKFSKCVSLPVSPKPVDKAPVSKESHPGKLFRPSQLPLLNSRRLDKLAVSRGNPRQPLFTTGSSCCVLSILPVFC